MLNTRFLLAVCVLLLMAGAYLYATPYLAALELRNATRRGDADAVSRRVNFPVLRENLKREINASTSGIGGNENPLAALGSVFRATATDLLVDALVTPESLLALMKGEGLLGRKRGGAEQDDAASGYRLEYQSLNEVSLLNVKDADQPTLVMTRSDLWGRWQITDVKGLELPP